jgi:DNA-binding response OmpR family regulator
VRGEATIVVATPSEAPGDVVQVDGATCLLVRPNQFFGPPGRVVILDDSDICRELVRFSLEPLGIEVVMLEDPAALLGTLAATPIDLLLLDLSFRDLDLGKLVRDIRTISPTTTLYLHSDRTPMELERIATTHRADGHLSKTLGAERFVMRVTKILRARRSIT